MKNLSELCQSCGKCCKCLVLPVKKPLKKAVMEEWLSTRGCEVVREDTDTMYVMVNQPCPSLLEQRWKNGTSTYSCGIYKSRPEGCQVFDGRKFDFLDCAWKEQKYVVLEKAFRMAKRQRGESETARERKEKKASGDYTPGEQRFRERAKRRREEQAPPEQ